MVTIMLNNDIEYDYPENEKVCFNCSMFIEADTGVRYCAVQGIPIDDYMEDTCHLFQVNVNNSLDETWEEVYYEEKY